MTDKEFNVGDKVWVASYEKQQVKKDCPICSGKMRVTLILGNGDLVETDCTYCERGFEKYGWIYEYEYVSVVRQLNITRKEVNESASGRDVEYYHEHWTLAHDKSFLTKQEAGARLEDMILEAEQNDLERIKYTKDQNPRKYSWLIGYYQRLKRDALREIERCDRRVTFFKKKVKESKND